MTLQEVLTEYEQDLRQAILLLKKGKGNGINVGFSELKIKLLYEIANKMNIDVRPNLNPQLDSKE